VPLHLSTIAGYPQGEPEKFTHFKATFSCFNSDSIGTIPSPTHERLAQLYFNSFKKSIVQSKKINISSENGQHLNSLKINYLNYSTGMV